jgi:Flp pilus assembly protein TadD
MKTASCVGVLAILAASLVGCASSGHQREQQAEAQSTSAEDEEAKCREVGEPGTRSHEECLARVVEKRVEADRIEAMRRESFQRTLGEGTSGLSDHR